MMNIPEKLRPSSRRGNAAQKPRPFRPQLERLECRETPSTLLGLGVGANANTIFRFDSAAPATTSQTAVTGLGTSTLVGFDFRPRTGQLVGLGVSGNTATLFTINALTGAATAIGSATVNSIAGATAFGVDFNPTVDRLRVVNNLASDGVGGNANNFRLNPNDGSLVAVDPDLDFTGMPGSNANAPEVGIAYSNSFDNQGGATTLFGIVSGGDRLVINGGASPGFSTLQNVGLLAQDTSNNVGFAISGPANTAFAILEVGGVSGLYSINLGNGLATFVGNVGNGAVDFGSLAIVPDSFVAIGADAGGIGRVIFRNAQTGQVLRNFVPFPGFTGGVRVAVGDINRDGMPDIVTARGPGGLTQVRVFDGLTGALIRNFIAFGGFKGGVHVAVGDVDRDGFGDIITGTGAGARSQVKVFSGAGPALLQRFFPYPQSFKGGITVGAYDMNNDGFDEIITGADRNGLAHVRVFTAASGVAVQFNGAIGNFIAFDGVALGSLFVAGGDVNGDGIADIITGSGARPHVKAFNGNNGAQIVSFFAYPPTFKGGVRVGVADFNNDGRFDIITAPGPGRVADVRAFDGFTGLQLGVVTISGNKGLFVAGGRF